MIERATYVSTAIIHQSRVHNFFTDLPCLGARALPCLSLAESSELSGVVLSRFTLSRSAVFTDVSLGKPEDSFSPLFKAALG